MPPQATASSQPRIRAGIFSLFGLIALIALAPFQGPVGGYTLAAGAAAALFYIVKHWITLERVSGPAVKDRRFRRIPEERQSAIRRIASGAFGDFSQMARACMLAGALVMTVQIGLNFWRDWISADQVAHWEYAIAHSMAQAKAVLSLRHVTLAALALCAASLVFHSARPIAVAARARKIAARVLGVLAFATSFTFVTADRAPVLYEQHIAPIRAAILGDLRKNGEARQDTAVLHWITADWSAMDTSESEADLGADLRALFDAGNARCRETLDAYERGFKKISADPFGRLNRTLTGNNCENLFNGWLAGEMVRQDAAARGNVQDASRPVDPAWIYDVATDADPVSRYVLKGGDPPDPDSLDRYRRKVADAAADAVAARAAIRGILVENIVSLVGPDSSAEVAKFIDAIVSQSVSLVVSRVEARVARLWAAFKGRPSSAFQPAEGARTVDRPAPFVGTPRSVFANESGTDRDVLIRAMTMRAEGAGIFKDAPSEEQRGEAEARAVESRNGLLSARNNAGRLGRDRKPSDISRPAQPEFDR